MAQKNNNPAAFDFEKFVSGCTQETRFVDIVQDRRALGVANDLATQIKARKADEEELGVKRTVSVGEPDLKKHYAEAVEQARKSTVTFEVSGVLAAVHDQMLTVKWPMESSSAVRSIDLPHPGQMEP